MTANPVTYIDMWERVSSVDDCRVLVALYCHRCGDGKQLAHVYHHPAAGLVFWSRSSAWLAPGLRHAVTKSLQREVTPDEYRAMVAESGVPEQEIIVPAPNAAGLIPLHPGRVPAVEISVKDLLDWPTDQIPTERNCPPELLPSATLFGDDLIPVSALRARAHCRRHGDEVVDRDALRSLARSHRGSRPSVFTIHRPHAHERV
jgi:hypothetical protein